MITISIQPFGRRKLAALGVAILCASTASCFADAMYLTAGRAPQRQAEQTDRRSETRVEMQTAVRQSELSRWTANFRQVNGGDHAIQAPAISDTACLGALRAG